MQAEGLRSSAMQKLRICHLLLVHGMLSQPFVEMHEDMGQRVARGLDRGGQKLRTLAPPVRDFLAVVGM
jgi:hypothetical protein